MIQFHIFPGGKRRIVTFSFDDGHENDVRLIEIFNSYGVKSTFHLNGDRYVNIDENEIENLRKTYEGHEVSCHTLRHGWPSRMPVQSVVGEVIEDRKILENIFKYPVIGMSYPNGSYSKTSISAMMDCGIVYSRTTKSTQNFIIPENFMEWHPSCHYKDAEVLCEKFLTNIDSEWTHPMFYIWGHSHELKNQEAWLYIENVVKQLSNNNKIWYATNIEIYNYMNAQKQLQISADETVFYNPTSIDVWVERNRKEIIEIPAGKTIVVELI